MNIKKKLVFYMMAATLAMAVAGCKDNKDDWENSEDNSLQYISLYDKPVNVIRQHIRGKWQFLYGEGGFNSKSKYHWENCFIEFTDKNQAIIYQDKKIEYVNITWQKEFGGYTGYNNFVYVADFGYGFCVFDKIVNDTLILHDFSADAIYYYFIKQNKK